MTTEIEECYVSTLKDDYLAGKILTTLHGLRRGNAVVQFYR